MDDIKQKRSIYLLGDVLWFVMSSTTGPNKTKPDFGPAVNAATQNLIAILAESFPQSLTNDDWKAMFKVTQNIKMPAHKRSSFNSQIIAQKRISGDDRFSPEELELMEKLKAMSEASRVAALYVCQSFWLQNNDLKGIEPDGYVDEARKAAMSIGINM